MSRTRPTSPVPVEVPVALKAAIQELISRVGGDGFLMELQTDDGQRYYLAFGQPATIRGFLGALHEAASPGEPPSIH